MNSDQGNSVISLSRVNTNQENRLNLLREITSLIFRYNKFRNFFVILLAVTCSRFARVIE